MRPFAAALLGAALVGGVLLTVVGLRPLPGDGRPVTPGRRRAGPLAVVLGDALPEPQRRRHRAVLGVSLAVGLVLSGVTGWVELVIVVPLLAVGLPILLRPPAATTDVSKLTALEQWTRGLSGVLTVGSGIEHALVASLSSTPAPIAPAVGILVARINARWSTEAALRAFADDLDDATGDLVAASLILGAQRRGPGLAAVLDDLAATVAEEVRIRRGIEADRAKPRTTATWVTILTLGVLGLLALNGSYIAPYRTPFGQVALLVFLAAYVGCLVWLRGMTRGAPTPRFLPPPPGVAGGRR